MPTSILILLFISGYDDNVCTIISISLIISEIRRTIETRKKYLNTDEKNLKQMFALRINHMLNDTNLKRTLAPVYDSYGFSTLINSKL